MKKYLGFSTFLVFFTVLLLSCASAELRVPGEAKIILKNISIEYYNIAEAYMGVKKYDKAAEYYQLAMRNEELYLLSYYKLARSYALAKNWEEAQKSYEYLLSLDPENTMIKTSLAYITAMSGEIYAAILKYKELLDLNPYDEGLLENYLALLINVGRGEDAEVSFFILKEKFPDNKQISTFAQKLAEIVDNFDPDKKLEAVPPPEGEGEVKEGIKPPVKQ